MGLSSSALTPRELMEFKKLNPNKPLDDVDIPEIEENRVPTDRNWLFVFIACIVILMPFLIYTLIYSDIRRLVYADDSCGNLCGVDNYKYDDIECSGKNNTNRWVLRFTNYRRPSEAEDHDHFLETLERTCVKQCESHERLIQNTVCIPSDDILPNVLYEINNIRDENENDDFTDKWVEIRRYLKDVALQLTFASFLALAVGLGMLFSFRYAVAAVVWSILIGSLLACAAITALFWYQYAESRSVLPDSGKNLLYFAVILTVITLVLLFVLIFARKKVHLVIALFKETAKAIFSMPLIIFTPLLTLVAQVLVILLYVITTAYMLSSGTLQKNEFGNYEFKPNLVMIFTLIFNTVIMIWILQFIKGIQYMVVAGAISKWYFAKNRHYVNSPISSSARIVFKFHLGSIAIGSFIITVMIIIRILITSIIKNERCRAFASDCMKMLESFLKFLSKNAYIITAMHGRPFFKSGKRAAKLLIQNASDIIAINSIGDFVLGMAQVIIMIVSVLIALGLLKTGPSSPNIYWALGIVAIVSLVIASLLFSVFETTIDTIFICFCEDSLLNDGMARPYAMSRELMEFVQNSKKIYAKK